MMIALSRYTNQSREKQNCIKFRACESEYYAFLNQRGSSRLDHMPRDASQGRLYTSSSELATDEQRRKTLKSHKSGRGSESLLPSGKPVNNKENISRASDTIKRTNAGHGLSFMFTNFENRLVKYIMEKQGLNEVYEENGVYVSELLPTANA